MLSTEERLYIRKARVTETSKIAMYTLGTILKSPFNDPIIQTLRYLHIDIAGERDAH